MHSYLIFKNELSLILNGAGFFEFEESIQSDVFGSAFSVFKKDKIEVKVIWDGKDGVGRVDILNNQESPEWDGASLFVNEKFKIKPSLNSQLERIKKELVQILDVLE